MQLKDPERNKLLAGPYNAPRTRPGKFLSCELRGKVRVYDFSDAPIPWPIGALPGRRWTIIVCGELVDAIKTESLKAVSYHWGVSHSTVSKWRQALGVERFNRGTLRLLRWAISDAMTPAVRRKLSAAAKGRKVVRSPEERARWLKRMKAGWTPRLRKRVAERMRRYMVKIKGRLGPVLNAWRPAQEKLLGTAPDREVARIIGRTKVAVALHRAQLGIPSFYAQRSLRPWTAREDELLRSRTDRTLAKVLQRSLSSVRARRKLMKIPCRPVYRPWTPEEDRLLGRLPDAEVARLVGRSPGAATARRMDLGVALQKPRSRPWTPAEEKLLGAEPDAEVARRLGRTPEAVRLRRLGLGIAGPARSGAVRPWTAKEERLLGKKPDREVARLLGRSLNAVRQRRKRKGLPDPGARAKAFSAAEIALFGTKPDADLALLFHRCASTVSKKRRLLGIPAFPRPAAAAPEPGAT